LIEIGGLVNVFVFNNKVIAPKEGQALSKSVIGNILKGLFLPKGMIIVFVFSGVVELLVVPLSPFGGRGDFHTRCAIYNIVNEDSGARVQIKVDVG
jgi:hypothetical protein